ncbi:hypothetical protein ACT3S2_07150 [Arthrobacter sp. AOP36-A1-22]|uniref:hypothetical protein n=1 Tax=Arthrobacter TaxID=1663 RepID=UPI003FD1DEDF
MTKPAFASSILSVLVEVIAGIAMIVIGVILQVSGSSGKVPNPTLTVTGGVLVALGGVLLSWLASRILSERQREESRKNAKDESANAVEVARAEIDEKLNNLSRVLGQAAGQISQTVEKFEMKVFSADTGFELISQANRTIYGQVNEIAVMRKSKFDSASLLDTAHSLDKLGRELASRSDADNSQQDSTGLAQLQNKINEVIEELADSNGSVPRASGKVRTTCPYCDFGVNVLVGATPGDTSIETCPNCGEVFNVHRNSAGAGFTRKFGPKGAENSSKEKLPRWKFSCTNCSVDLFASQNGKGERTMVCSSCFFAFNVDPTAESAIQIGQLDKMEAVEPYRSGSRPKAPCPKCKNTVNMALRYDDGFFGFCPEDMVALVVTDKNWDDLNRQMLSET